MDDTDLAQQRQIVHLLTAVTDAIIHLGAQRLVDELDGHRNHCVVALRAPPALQGAKLSGLCTGPRLGPGAGARVLAEEQWKGHKKV